MSDINNILKDQSNNDKILVKELSKYIINHRNNNGKFDKKLVNKIIDIVLRNYEINYSEIEYTDEGIYLGGWDHDEKIIIINMNLILKNANNTKDWFGFKDKNIYRYYCIIETIIHEVTHARQQYINEKSYNNFYYNDFIFLEKNYDDYISNYEHILVERFAKLRGCIIGYNVMSYVCHENELDELKKMVFYTFLTGYDISFYGEKVDAGWEDILYEDSKIISPVEYHNELMENHSYTILNTIDYENMDLFERFYLGLNISLDEYQKLLFRYNNRAASKDFIGLIRKS